MLSSHHFGRVAFASGGSKAWWDECSHLSEERPESPPGLCQEKGAQAFGDPWVLEVASLPAFHSSGKFGAVCTCTERSTGLKLAAKVIKKQTPKDKVVGECWSYSREMFSEWTSLISCQC